MTRPQYEHEVVGKHHENVNMGQIVEARNNLVSGFDPNIIKYKNRKEEV